MSEGNVLPVYVQALYGARTRQPLVHFVIGERRVDLTTTKAREIAQMLVEAAEAAEGDGFLVEFMREEAGLEDGQIGPLLAAFRQRRETWREGPL